MIEEVVLEPALPPNRFTREWVFPKSVIRDYVFYVCQFFSYGPESLHLIRRDILKKSPFLNYFFNDSYYIFFEGGDIFSRAARNYMLCFEN